MNYDKIGTYIKNLRIKSKMSQNDLARELGIGREAVSKWENGITLPDIENLIIISKIFKVSVDELLQGESINDKPKKDIYYELCKEKNLKNEYLKKNIRLLASLVIVLSISSILFLSYLFYDAYNNKSDNNSNIVEVNEDNQNNDDETKDLTYSNSLLNITKS